MPVTIEFAQGQPVVGPTGPQGPQGVIGPQGFNGTVGTTGPQGATGPQGVIGPQGATGAASTVAGPQGATGASDYSASVSAQTGVTYAFVASDNGKIVTFNNASTITVTVPINLGVGFNVVCVQLGVGQVSFVAGASATLNHRQNHTRIAGQRGVASILATTTSAYYLSGDTSL